MQPKNPYYRLHYRIGGAFQTRLHNLLFAGRTLQFACPAGTAGLVRVTRCPLRIVAFRLAGGLLACHEAGRRLRGWRKGLQDIM